MSWIAEDLNEFTNKEVFKASDSRTKKDLFRQCTELVGAMYEADISGSHITTNVNEKDNKIHVNIKAREPVRVSTQYLFTLEEDIKKLRNAGYRVNINEYSIFPTLYVSERKSDNTLLHFYLLDGKLSFDPNVLEDRYVREFIDKIATDILKIKTKEDIISK